MSCCRSPPAPGGHPLRRRDAAGSPRDRGLRPYLAQGRVAQPDRRTQGPIPLRVSVHGAKPWPQKLTAATTGNHGASAAAYAARAGVTSLIFCDPETPQVLRDLIQLYGGRVVLLRERQAFLAKLVRDLGWYPSTGLTPMPVGTPYGVESYKSIAYEIYFQLGGRFPDRGIVPVGSGDVLYGPWKGFRELA